MNLVYTKSAFFALAGRVISAGAQFLLTVIITRFSGTEEAGIFFSIYVWILLASAMGQCGLSMVALRLSEVARENQGLKIRSILIVTIVSACILGGGSLFFANFFIDIFSKSNVSIVFLMLWVAGFSINQINADIYRGLNNQIAAALLGSIGLIVMLLAVIIVFLSGGAFNNIFIAIPICWSVIGMGGIFFTLRTIKDHNIFNPGRNTVSASRVYEVMREAAKSMLASIFAFIATQADQLVLSSLYSAPTYAIYTAGVKCAQVFGIVANMLNSYIGPILLASIRSGKDNIQDVIQKNNRHVSLLIIPLVMLFVFFSKVIVEFLFGKNYTDASVIFSFFIVASAFNICTGPKGFLLWLLGHERTVIKIMTFFAALISIFCCIAVGSVSMTMIALIISIFQIFQYIVEGYFLKVITKLNIFKF